MSSIAATAVPVRRARTRRFRLRTLVSAFWAAQRMALALESNRRPNDLDLQVLGIAPGAFDRAR
ncbi:hypothetical protein [Antarcticirhabdus aurantiaca]|uniref:Uncharacterized protein n=1 Tax=Antarcticirhabdus aurantiaca TaxID=2606717 RepID=A0ACD4NUT4_9HYPH|nr:hypothetical protein [Antarcticirhabdus aurantiaca]WAJ30636.1 hypothetical protein OXU80_10695 [Jeongeuplla avenae]